ncbi:ATP-dependent Clp protease, proteolytic subunit ClpP [Bacillus cereus VD133]|uniref:ATP-dependent Clp protease proteolytic subunit n=1 Tax=Bacillus cereus VD133 TaxID=1053233 RepID=A0A9W5PLG8_BACCE|nr:head maturation protease, ClpP-related [Bacillus cereus]EOO28623.1 ATP-dependent Clp protease, proteolytic subunit ClpP [Bacillus cereus VD133]
MGKAKKTNKFWEMKMSAHNASTADVFLYGEVTKYAWEEYGEVSSTLFKQELDDLGEVDTLNLHINSPGGSVFEGITIFNMLKMHKAKVNVYVDALAASIASVIAMCGDQIYMHKNSMMMIHHAWTYASGNAQQLRKAADDIEKISKSSSMTYVERAGDKLTEDKLEELLTEETWLSAEEALSYGLCDVVLEANEAVASISERLCKEYKNIPQQFMSQLNQSVITSDEMKERQRIAEEAKVNKQYMETILGGMYS